MIIWARHASARQWSLNASNGGLAFSRMSGFSRSFILHMRMTEWMGRGDKICNKTKDALQERFGLFSFL